MGTRGIDILRDRLGTDCEDVRRKMENFEIGRFLHLKPEIRNSRLDCRRVQFKVSDFGFEMQESSSRPISQSHNFFLTYDAFGFRWIGSSTS